jgi:pimeloyl-ACP methyl ester carboxylesterase
VLYAYTRALTATPERFARLQRFLRWQLDPEHTRTTMDAVDGMRRFARPTLLLWGQQDTNFGPGIAERLASDIPGVVGIQYFEHSAHMPFQEEPERYAEAVTRFLSASEASLAREREAFRAQRQPRQKGATL